jgi:hypothetical protein
LWKLILPKLCKYLKVSHLVCLRRILKKFDSKCLQKLSM